MNAVDTVGVVHAVDARARSTRHFRAAAGIVVAAAIAVRLWPVLTRHMLTGLLEYDDGVYYNAAAHLVGGALPYRDFTFLQPPGITVLLAPFAALARAVGDPIALAAARLGIVLVASVNVSLLMRLVRQWSGPVAALWAGAAYAAWGGAAAAERTVLLEPVIGLGLLGALTLLGGPGRRSWPGSGVSRVAAAGAVLGLALTVKTWVAADVAVLAVWLLRRCGWRAAVTLTTAAAGAAAVVCLPFLIAAPKAMVHQVVSDQLWRTQKLTPNNTVFLHQVAGVGHVYRVDGAGEWAVIAVLAAAALAVIVTLWSGPRLWAVLAIVQAGLVLPQNSYTYHYIDFAAPALAACAGVTMGAVARSARRLGRPAQALGGMAVGGALAMLAWQAAAQDVVGSPLPATLSGFMRAHPCAFADYPPLMPATGAETPQVRRHCPNLVDYTGAALSAGDGRMLVAYGRGGHAGQYRPPRWQAQVRRVLAVSDAAVLSWRPQDWTAATVRLFDHRFHLAGRAGPFTLWTLRTPRS